MNSSATNLPAEIQKLIAKVVKRTRLRKAERADIERELSAHFRDGLASGKSVDQLIEAFGNTKVSAKSIRAGAIAKRSPLDRAIRNTAIAFNWMCLVLAAFYVLSVVYLWMHSPVISFNPIERIQATLPAVSDHDRAWPIYKQGLLALTDPVEKPVEVIGAPIQYPQLKFNWKGLGPSEGNAIPNDPNWTAQSKVMRERRAGIDTLVRAASMPALGYVPNTGERAEDADIYFYDPAPSAAEPGLELFSYSIGLSHLSILREASRLLGTDSLMAIEERDGERFIRDIEAIIRLSHHCEEARFLISQLVGSAIRGIAFQRIIMVMEWRPDALNDEQLKRLAALLRTLPARDYEVDLGMEVLGMQDFIQRIYTDNGSGNGWFNPGSGLAIMQMMVASPPDSQSKANTLYSFFGSIGAPLGAAWFPSRKEVTELHSALMRKTEEQSRRPLWEQNFSYETELMQQMESNELAKARWIVVRLLVPAVSHSAKMRRLCESQCIAAQTAIALTQYRRAHGGAWPEKIDQLVPNYLDTVPPEPWTGTPINYQVKDGRPYVWSMGTDAKAPNKIDELNFPGWVNTSPTNKHPDKYWLWFLGDDKLERWKPATN